jgi:hypothetical protein
MVRHTDEDLVNVESIAITSVLSFQSACINGAKLATPETDGFAGDSDASLGQKIFDITVTQIESIAEPYCVTDNVGRESVTFVYAHGPTIAIWAS